MGNRSAFYSSHLWNLSGVIALIVAVATAASAFGALRKQVSFLESEIKAMSESITEIRETVAEIEATVDVLHDMAEKNDSNGDDVPDPEMVLERIGGIEAGVGIESECSGE